MELLRPVNDPSFPTAAVAYTGTAGSTNPWPAGPQGVLVWTTTAAYVVVGEGVTATATNGTPIPANTPIPFAVPGGTGAPWRVSAVQISAGGTLYAEPINKN